MQTNKSRKPAAPVFTHTGGPAVRGTPLARLRRTVLNCLLWEDNFHESGVSVADRMKSLVKEVRAEDVFNLAIEARNDFGLRHAPLLLAREMARGSPEHRKLVSAVLPAIINRPDEIAEFTALYWASNTDKKQNPHYLTHPIRRGLGLALNKFNEFQLAKWDRKEKEVRIRDAMFMAHVTPNDLPAKAPRWSAAERKEARKLQTRAWPFTEREALHFKVADDLLKQEGTWEDRLSAGENAKDVFTELMQKRELGGLAYIRNLRKMTEAGVDVDLIKMYSELANLRGIFPHQLITSARVNKQYEPILDEMLLRCTAEMPKLAGKTLVLVDVSGSMDAPLSRGRHGGRMRFGAATETVQETTRMDAAAAIAVMARELCEEVRIFSFSDRTVEVPARRGIALLDAINGSQSHGSTMLREAITRMNKVGYDRLIVVTDEQAQDGGSKPLPDTRAYMCNVAPYEHSVADQNHWHKIDGWSPQVIRWITQLEDEGMGVAE